MLRKYKADKIYEMNKLNELFDDLSPMELLFRVGDDFSIDHNYFTVDRVGNIKSFENYTKAESYLKAYTDSLDKILQVLGREDEPGIIINYNNSQILDAGDKDALIYRLETYRDQNPVIVKLPKDDRFIRNLLRRQNLIKDFHQLTTDMFD